MNSRRAIRSTPELSKTPEKRGEILRGGSCIPAGLFRGSPQPFEHHHLDIRKLSGVERTKPANGTDGWVGGNALGDKCPVFEKGNLNLHLKLRSAKRGTCGTPR